LVALLAHQGQARYHQDVQISPIATVERIEEDLRVGGPGEPFGEDMLPPIHGLVGGGEEAWTPWKSFSP